MTNASDDPVIHEAIAEFGPLGYWFFFGILELIGKNFNPKTPGKLEISWKQMQRLFHKSHTNVQILLNYFSTKGKLTWQDRGSTIIIYVPKFKDFADEYTKRRLIEVSGQTPDTYRDKLHPDKNRTDKTRIDKNISGTDPEGADPDLDSVSEQEPAKIGGLSQPIQRMSDARLRDECWDILNGLGLDSSPDRMHSVKVMFEQYPPKTVKESFMATKDRQEQDKTGVSTEPLQNPLGYMNGCLKMSRNKNG